MKTISGKYHISHPHVRRLSCGCQQPSNSHRHNKELRTCQHYKGNCSYHRRKQWIGLAVAKRFVNEGAVVFIAGRRQAELDKAAKEIGTNVITARSDVFKLKDLDRLYEEIAEKKGKIDILFANRGIVETRGNAGSNS